MRRTQIYYLFSLSLGLSILFGLFTSAKQTPAYKRSELSAEERVKDLIQRMTLDEKLMQVQAFWLGNKEKFTNADGSFNEVGAKEILNNGIGHIARPSEGPAGNGGFGFTAEENAIYTNAIQKFLLEETRLGIPALFHEECLHGHAARDATSFPQPIALASSFDRELVEQLFIMTAREAKVRGTHQALSPVLDVTRDPRWGRTEETYGEDPYLAGEIGLAAIFGFQGRSEKIEGDHILATLKHMTGHGEPEGGNNIGPAHISERTVREAFLPPFKKAVQVGRVRSVMASYNEIDGVPSHASTWLLQDILRGEWAFKGSIVSDYSAIRELHDRHKIVADHQAAAIKAMETGIDIELPNPEVYPLLKDAIEKGKMKEAVLDTAVARILRHKFEMGLFEDPYVDPQRAKEEVGSEANAKLALKAAEESIILLQNEGSLAPLNASDYKTIAVIGPNADQTLLGGYSSYPKYFITVLEGIKAKLGNQVKVVYAEGCGISKEGSWYKDPVFPTDEAEDRAKVKAALKVAKKADLVILAIGGNELTSREAWAESHLGDRTDLQMVGLQDELVNGIAALGKPTVALLFNGRPLAVTNLKEKVPTIFECWYLGQETGHAVANVLFGDINPSGKLPITIPRSVGHLPAYYNYKPTARRGYLWDEGYALWPFGYGMSYTSFTMGKPTLSKATISRFESTSVEIEIQNTGSRAGKEVVQLYIRDDISSVTRPVMELRGFEKMMLEAGEKQKISFSISPEDLAFYDEYMRFGVESGTFTIMVGTSSRKEDLQLITLTVTE
ncbi:MAG: glycoside hydrolase family 3 N-terminal domain-containing protein [Bacteroidia bacterium]